MEPDKKGKKNKKVLPKAINTDILKEIREAQERICGVFIEIEGWVYDMACLN